MTRSPIRLRNGLRVRPEKKILNNFDYEYYDSDETSRTAGNNGKIRLRAKVGEYDPNRVVQARPSKFSMIFIFRKIIFLKKD